MEWEIPLFEMYWDQGDIEAVNKVIKRGTFWTNGPEIEQFEKTIAQFVGKRYALTFNSGTSALQSLLLACNLKGGEVIVPSFTFVATANAIVLAGASPLFAEVELETFGLNAEDVRKRITNKTKAVLLVHYGGCPARDTEKIKKLCDEKKILLLEDAAESLGAKINQKKVGSFGEAAMFSLCQNKIITCGEGGIIVTDSEELYGKMKLIRSHGRVENTEGINSINYFSSIDDNDYVEASFNFRMSTISAALGLSQLNKIDFLIKSRRKLAHHLNENLKNIKELSCPLPPNNFEHVYQMYTLVLKEKERRDALQKFLKENRIMSKIYFSPVHLKTFYRSNYGHKENDLPLTEQLSQRVLTIPLYVNLSDGKREFLLSNIKRFFEEDHSKEEKSKR